MKLKIKNHKSKMFLITAFLQMFFEASLYCQKYENGTRLLKGAEVLSATPLQLDYVLENLADTAKITVNLHEGKTHLVLNDGSGKWREWWYHQGRWKVKSQDIPPETDPTVPSHVKNFTTGNIINWNNAYDWGNHAGQGYLKNNSLPIAETSVLGAVKVGKGLTATNDGTLSTTANDVTFGTFKPVITGGAYESYTLTSNSYGYYWRNNKVVHLEIYFKIENVSGTNTGGTEIHINIPEELAPYNMTGYFSHPAGCIKLYSKILKPDYIHLGVAFFSLISGVIQLFQSNDTDVAIVRNLEIGSFIEFSINYISN
jgi:hypothetical protein